MARKISFANGEIYHVYNRGIDKRDIFSDQDDLERFKKSLEEFNVVDPIGSIYENSFAKKCRDTQLGGFASKLVEIIAGGLNPNHYHLILEQVADRGIEKFLHRLGTGYTMYFNGKNHRSGSLFQGVFKSVHVDSNEYLLRLSVYVNLNDRVHQLGGEASKLRWSSWGEYVGEVGSGEMVCAKDIILSQFDSQEDYKKFAEETLPIILESKQEQKELEDLLLE